MPETTTRRSPRWRDGAAWLLAPATEEVPRAHLVGAAALRILVGLMWLYNVSWKQAPDFGEKSGNGLYEFTSYAVSDPVFPPYGWLVEHLVLPAFAPFGWAVLALETTLAVLLLAGAWVRVAAALGAAQSLAIAFSVAAAPNEWPWSYWLMIGVHGLLLVGAAGRVLAVDAVRAGVSSGRTLGLVWGALTMLMGLFSVALSLGDPLAARGPGLRVAVLQIGLGEFNLIGGLVLAAVGALLLAARGGAAGPAWAATVLAVLGGLSLHAQLGFAAPLLGGTPTSAAYLFSAAVIGTALARAPGRARA